MYIVVLIQTIEQENCLKSARCCLYRGDDLQRHLWLLSSTAPLRQKMCCCSSGPGTCRGMVRAVAGLVCRACSLLHCTGPRYVLVFAVRRRLTSWSFSNSCPACCWSHDLTSKIHRITVVRVASCHVRLQFQLSSHFLVDHQAATSWCRLSLRSTCWKVKGFGGLQPLPCSCSIFSYNRKVALTRRASAIGLPSSSEVHVLRFRENLKRMKWCCWRQVQVQIDRKDLIVLNCSGTFFGACFSCILHYSPFFRLSYLSYTKSEAETGQVVCSLQWRSGQNLSREEVQKLLQNVCSSLDTLKIDWLTSLKEVSLRWTLRNTFGCHWFPFAFFCFFHFATYGLQKWSWTVKALAWTTCEDYLRHFNLFSQKDAVCPRPCDGRFHLSTHGLAFWFLNMWTSY